MSYILDALKKAEQTRHRAARVPTLATVHRAPAASRRRLWPWIVAAAMILANASALAWLLRPTHTISTPPPPTSTTSQAPASPAAPPALELRPPAPREEPASSVAALPKPAPVIAPPPEAAPPKSDPISHLPASERKPMSARAPESKPSTVATLAPAVPNTAPQGPRIADMPLSPIPSASVGGQAAPPPSTLPAEGKRAIGAPLPPAAVGGQAAAAPIPPPASGRQGAAAPAAPPGASATAPPRRGTSAEKTVPSMAPPTAPTPERAGGPPPVAREVPQEIRDLVGRMKLQRVVYSDDAAQRLVFIDNQKYVEGSSIDGKLIVESITPDGAVLSYEGKRFELRQ